MDVWPQKDNTKTVKVVWTHIKVIRSSGEESSSHDFYSCDKERDQAH